MTSTVPFRRWRGAGRAVLLAGPLVLALGACGAPGGDPGRTGSTPAATPTGPASSPTAATASPGGSATPSAGASSATASPKPSSRPSARCADLVQRLTLEERVGQLLMVAVTSTGVTPEQASVVRRTRAGSVILLGNTTAGLAAVQRVVADVRDAAVRPQQVSVLLAADQEGGMVQRLAGDGFSDIPSAEQQAQLSRAELTAKAEAWGDELAEAGIHADLAPVADVVPRELTQVNEPIAKLRRGYGASPRTVAEKVRAFTTGMDRAGIATAVKHFPGLGRVRGNTDFTSRVVDTVTTRKDAGLAGFRAAVEAEVDMVMVSSAVYDRIDRRRQAVFSAAVVDGMLRDGLGFDGVVISDDLSAAAVRNLQPGRRAVEFVRAGGDLAIVGDPAEAGAMAEAMVERARTDPDFAERVDESAARMLALKDRRGLTGC